MTLISQTLQIITPQSMEFCCTGTCCNLFCNVYCYVQHMPNCNITLVEDLFVQVKPAHSCAVASMNILYMCAIKIALIILVPLYKNIPQ